MAQGVHLPLLAKRADLFEVAALCDLSPGLLEAIGERCGVPPERRFRSLDDLLAAGGVDAVMVLTSGSHGAAAAAAARAGLPVFCEKPLCYTIAEADALAGPDVRLALGYMKLYDPAFRRARELLAGRPPARSIEVTVLHPATEAQVAHLRLVRAAGPAPPPDDKLLERALGPAPPELRRLYTEVLLGSVVHDLAVVRDLAGNPVRIDHVEVWDATSAAILATLPGEARLSIRWHYLERYPAYREEVRVHDEEGTVALTFPSPYLLHAPTELTVVDGAGESARTTRFRSTVEAFEKQLAAFHRLVVSGEPAAAGVAEGRADIVTCQRVARRLAELRGLPIGGEAAGS